VRDITILISHLL